MKPLFKKKNADPIVEEISQTVQDAQYEAVSSAPENVAPVKGKLPLTHRTSAKFVAFLLVIIMSIVAVGSAVGAIVMINEELYITSEWTYENDAMRNLAEGDVYTLIRYLTNEDLDAGERDAMHYLADRNIASVEMTFSDGPRKNWGYDGGKKDGDLKFSGTWYHEKYKDALENWYTQYRNDGENYELLGTVEATILLADEFTEQDTYFFVDRLISLIYALRYWVYGIGICAVILAIAAFVFLICASGRKNGLPTVQPGWGTKIPFDLLTGMTAFAGFLMIQVMVEASYYGSDIEAALAYIALGIALMVVALGWCMSFATRIKLGCWWKNTIIFYALKIALVVLRKLWGGVCWCFRGMVSLCRGIPLVWKTALGLAAIALIEILVIAGAYCEEDVLITFWFGKYLVVVPLVLYVALMLRKLQKGGKALASGDLGYQVDTKRMFWDFKRHGENLNSIGVGMTAAVEQRLKSERMKTELITNVSHDIKTPLTSIINYADLIEKERCDNPAITEYAGVLHRQSDRLKRLIDDLVEASKASTGNLEVLLAPCEVGVMLTQTAGEYEQKLQEKDLILVTHQPEQAIKIMADGRRLWRVFDNLMNNVCKYAQRSTRVYLTLEEKNGQAIISFKNISREPLNLSADELLERFVQGDNSRKSEGNGLGLSIAKSLTELQNGTMELTTDGDLFKVVLRFPTIS